MSFSISLMGFGRGEKRLFGRTIPMEKTHSFPFFLDSPIFNEERGKPSVLNVFKSWLLISVSRSHVVILITLQELEKMCIVRFTFY